MKYMIRISLFLMLFALITFTSCNDESDNGSGKSILRIHLTDSPGDYKAVYIDLREIRINATDDDHSGWITLDNINAGVYDLMKLTNGVDTLLGESEIPSGTISQIRLILGDKNSVIDGKDSTGMKTPSAQQSGLKLKVNETFESDLAYDILLDFDAASSVVKAGKSGNYNLKPVIRSVVEQSTGSIRGIVNPGNVKCAVFAILGEDSVGTFTNENGMFLIKGLTPEVYSLYVDPGDASGLKDSTLVDIEVELGIVTNVGEIFLEEE